MPNPNAKPAGGITDDGSFGTHGQTAKEEQAEIADLIGNGPAGDVVEEEGEEENAEETETGSEEEPSVDEGESSTEEDQETVETGGEEQEEEPEVKEEKKEVKKPKEDPLISELERLSTFISEDEKSLLGKQDISVEKPEEKGGEKEEKKEEKKEIPKESSFDTFVKDVLTPKPLEGQEFVKADDFKGSLEPEDVQKINSAFNNVIQVAVQEGRKQAIRDGMEVFPKVLSNQIRRMIAANDFWRDNSDIRKLCNAHPKLRTYVNRVATDIQTKNPDATLSEIFDKTAMEVRKVLGKERMSQFEGGEVDSSRRKKPAFASKPTRSGHRKPTEKAKVPEEAEEIQELIEWSDKFGM